MAATKGRSVLEETPWPIKKENYELNEVIGKGSTAVVQVANCLPRNEVCAIKRISLELVNHEEHLLKEIRAMRQCKHPNLITFYQAFVVKKEVWLVMKLLGHGSVLNLIKHREKTNQNKQGVFDEIAIATMLKDVLKAIEYLHRNGHIHRDVKSGNILLADDGSVLLADLGVSSRIAVPGERGLKQATRHTFVGTPCWMAPEVMEQSEQGYDEKADIWSFGILAIEMATGKAPYHKYPPMKIVMLTLQNDPPGLDTCVTDKNITKKYSKLFRKMIEACMQREPSRRPSAAQLLKDPFFKKAKRPEYIQKTLLTDAPRLKDFGVKPRRVAGSSGRLHKTDDGEYEWSDEWEFDDSENENTTTQELANQLQATTLKAPENIDAAGTTAGTTIEEEDNHDTVQLAVPPNTTAGGDQGSLTESVSSTIDTATLPAAVAAAVMKPIRENRTFEFLLRLRTNATDLSDISFQFEVGKDTPDLVAQELVAAGLIEGRDKIIVAANVSKLVDAPTTQSVKFPLTGNLAPNEYADERTLVGFASLALKSST